MNLAVVDLDYGNIGSVRLAFERLGLTPVLTSDRDAIASADRVVLPGVGAAGYAMQRIDELGLRDVLMSLKQPALGICLGMQLLFEQSEETDTRCLGIIPGAVRALEPEPGRPVPHMGWARLDVGDADIGLATGDYVYFANGYAADPGEATVASAEYGREIPAAVRRGNWLGAQFHPERSGETGARFLKRFLEQPSVRPEEPLSEGSHQSTTLMGSQVEAASRRAVLRDGTSAGSVPPQDEWNRDSL